ncbi:MAG: PIN domain-containing protein [Vicinamibacteria bacterium]
MTATLADTGPIVAFLNARDRHHRWAVEAMGRLRPPLVTCESVLSEAAYLVRSLPEGGARVMELVTRGVLRVDFDVEREAAALSRLLRRYASLPMDFADACLVRLSEIHADSVVFTLDSEFRDVYRRNGRQVIPTLSPPRIRR